MTRKEVKAVIEKAYADLAQVIPDPGFGGNAIARLFDRLSFCALRQEREHRKGCSGTYSSSVVLAARYFVVQAVHSDRYYTALNAPSALAGLAELREDIQLGAMLGAWLRREGKLPPLDPAFRKIDYAKELAGS